MRVTALLLLSAALPAAAQEVGQPAGELSAAHWYNWIGDGPSIEALRGRTILVHFFKVEEPEKNGFMTLCKFHEEHADKGLVILAVAPEAKGVVRRLLQDYPLPKDDGEKQARGTFHYTCVVYDNYPGERYKIVAFQGCTALMDRSVGRIFFSVAAEAVARGGQSGEGGGGGG